MTTWLATLLLMCWTTPLPNCRASSHPHWLLGVLHCVPACRPASCAQRSAAPLFTEYTPWKDIRQAHSWRSTCGLAVLVTHAVHTLELAGMEQAGGPAPGIIQRGALLVELVGKHHSTPGAQCDGGCPSVPVGSHCCLACATWFLVFREGRAASCTDVDPLTSIHLPSGCCDKLMSGCWLSGRHANQ